MTLQYADAAEKTLVKAVPTVDTDGNVIKWDIEVQYSLNDYTSKYSKMVDVEPTKAPEAFTKEEVFGLTNPAHLDMVFDSQYESVMVPAPSSETKVDDFDINSLA
jgi:hypothetical protein